MSCPGVHCPGCSGGESLGILGGVVIGLVLADRIVPWVAARIWWIGGTAAVSVALAVAFCMWLERWTEVRSSQFAARHGILSRADVTPGISRRVTVAAPVTVVSLGRPERAAIEASRPAWPHAPQLHRDEVSR